MPFRTDFRKHAALIFTPKKIKVNAPLNSLMKSA